jgi:hypothetical protein
MRAGRLGRQAVSWHQKIQKNIETDMTKFWPKERLNVLLLIKAKEKKANEGD